MSLDQFRNSRLPGEDDAYPVCSGDAVTLREDYKAMRAELKQPFRDVGGITCMFAHPGYNGQILPKFMEFGNTSTWNNYFYFYRFGGDGQYVLFLIEVSTTEVEKFDAISNAFAQKLGQPKNVEVNDLQNGFGAIFHNVIVTFENSSSVIRLTKYDGSLDHFTTMYWLKQVASEVNYIRAAADKSAQKL